MKPSYMLIFVQRIICTMLLTLTVTTASAIVVWADLDPNEVIDASGPGGAQYAIFNPFAGPDVFLTLDAAGLSIVAGGGVNAAMPVLGANDIDYQVCGQELNAASNWQPVASDPAPAAGSYFAGFMFTAGADEHYAWIHFSIDPIAQTLTIIEYAYQNDAGIPIEVCEGSPTANTPAMEICGNGIDDDGDGDIDFADADCPCVLGLTPEVGGLTLSLSGSNCTNDQLVTATPDFLVDSYSWFLDGVGIPSEVMATLDVEALTLGEGTYTALAVGELGCASNTLAVTDDVLSGLISLDPNVLVCGESEAQLQAQVAMPSAYTYLWASIDGVIQSGATTLDPIVSASGTYTLTVSQGDCTESQSVVVDFAAATSPQIAFDIEQLLSCEGTEVMLVNRSSSDVLIDSYEWEVDGLVTFTTPDISLTSMSSEAIEVSLRITDDQGCVSDSLTIINPVVHQPPTAEFTSNLTGDGLSIEFTDRSQVSGAYERLWYFGDETMSTDSMTTHRYALGGAYEVVLTVTDSLACTDTAIRSLMLEDPLTIFIPTAFTPDGDGINDRWEWSLLGADELELSIYDRDGHILYSSDELHGSWGGGSQASDYYSKDGVYTYVLKARRAGQGWVQKQGVLTLLR